MLARSPARVLLLGTFAAALMAPSLALAQVPLIGGLGGPRGYGAQCLCPNDDGSSVAIDLRPAFPSGLRFFDRTHTTAYVNTNGNITFSGPLPTYTPRAFPVANQPMIAPYWADVDTRSSYCSSAPAGGGCGFSATTCQNRAENEVWWTLEPGRMVVTWHRVGYFACHDDRRMNFQLILTAAPDCGPGGVGNFDVEFRYNECNWTTGDASGGSGGFGGTPAQAGFDAGNSRDYVEIMGSRTNTIHTILCTMSNVGMPGIWRFQIRGGTVMCPGAGGPCNTGMQGVCSEGRLQCVGSGTSCVPVVSPGPRRCNGLDNDCDGMIDTGDDLCPVGSVCDRGACVPRCVEGSCFAGETCTPQGTCVETACADVTCPAGQQCRGGRCVGACEGVVCPHGQVCRAGRCVDPCEGVTCEMGSVCVDGLCQARCPCRSCASGESCTSDGRCVPSACASVTCGAGQYCRDGACVDACEGAICPSGYRCETGNCVPDMTQPDAGVQDSSLPPVERDSGLPPVDQDGGSAIDARGDARGGLTASRQPGCGCKIAGARASRAPWALGLMLAALAGVRRRRRVH